MRRVFISDCEGPISKNDNAFEAASHFIPEGDKIFAMVSRYDDVLADIIKRPGHNAGSTLKLIIPFLKAYDVTDEAMETFAKENLLLVKDAKAALKFIGTLCEGFIISASYEHYIKALCKTLDLPFKRAYCTRVSFNAYHLSKEEKIELRKIAGEITTRSQIAIPMNARNLQNLSEESQATIRWLDETFRERIARMKIGRVYSEVNPVGGKGKADAIRNIVRNQRVKLADVLYVGDSITDEQAFKLVKRHGGLTVSFNGNDYAVENADIAILSETCLATAVVTEVFAKDGKEAVMALLREWSYSNLKEHSVDENLIDRLRQAYPDDLPKATIVTPENKENLIKTSTKFRKRVRGELVGGLG